MKQCISKCIIWGKGKTIVGIHDTYTIKVPLIEFPCQCKLDNHQRLHYFRDGFFLVEWEGDVFNFNKEEKKI